MSKPAYTHLASWYEQLMDADYDLWADYLNLLIDLNPSETRVLDLGCGTGKLSRKMMDIGYQVIGVDASSEMLNIAWQANQHYGMPLIQQNLTELELDKQFEVIISTCDVFNYLTTEEELENVLNRIQQHLKPGGRLFFDISSQHKLSNYLGNHRDNYVTEDFCYIWNNDWNDEKKLLTMDLVIFAKNEHGFYERFEEEHLQRGWFIEEVTALVNQSGLLVEAVYSAFTVEPVADQAERIQFVVRKKL